MSKLHIGPYMLASRLILAPMAGVSDRPFRQLCRQWGAGMVVAEMLTSDTSLWDSRKSSLRLIRPDDPEPRAVQIAGNDPAMMAHAAQQCVAIGAQIIDINMGCPAKKVCNKAAGSALMQDELLVADILTAVVNAVTVPVTLKIRTGWDESHKNAPQIAKIAEDAGISALAIHGRTRNQLYKGCAEYDTIALVKQQRKIPILANGDIDSPEKAHYVLAYTQADGLLIGRAAQGKPWLFQQINHYLRTGQLAPALALSKVEQTILQHLTELHQFYGEHLGLRIARKHVQWYLADYPEAKAFRSHFNQLECPQAQSAQVQDFFQTLYAQGLKVAA